MREVHGRTLMDEHTPQQLVADDKATAFDDVRRSMRADDAEGDVGATFELFETIEIRDPAIDIEQLVSQIRANLARRRPLPPLASALGRVRMSNQRLKLLASITDLQRRMREYGMVESHKDGWLRRIDLVIKRSIRRLMLRHILQQHRIHLKLHTVLDQLISYLQDEDNCVRACVDQVQRQCDERSRGKDAKLA
jgi:hypothetical protein